jgi:p-hydroxybenzoate 3-monooxygenase
LRTQVAIIGGGPSGLLLSQLLNLSGIATIVLEQRSREYVMARIRAGVLERGSVEQLRLAGAGERMGRDGLIHHGCHLSSGDQMFRIDFTKRCGHHVMVYGQTEVTKDLYAAQDRLGATIIDEAANVAIHDADTAHPNVTYDKDGHGHRIDCDVIAGCDGFHGVSRETIPAGLRQDYERVYPFGWLGVLSETPPVSEEIIYARSPSGFALASMRSPALSRCYIQVPSTARVEDWSDGDFWDEFRRRLPEAAADQLVTGPAVEKSIAPLRSFVSEPMRWGRLFLCGDAAHIVPPTGAKGLNLAISDVHYLADALRLLYQDSDSSGIDAYSERALARVWKGIRFSWWMTTLLHRFEGESDFEQRIRDAEFDYLANSVAAQAVLAENYTGLSY